MPYMDMSGGQLRIRPDGDPTFSPIADRSYVDEESKCLVRERELRFSYASGVVNVGTALPAGSIVKTVSVLVVTPFDNTGPTLTVGDAGDAARFMTAAENDLTIAKQYDAYCTYYYASAEQVTATITPAGSVNGVGLIVITYTEV